MKQALAAFVGLLASMASAQTPADPECACLTASQLSSVEGWSDAKFVDSDGMKKVTLSGITYTYPALYGLENCAAHDATQKPYCDVADPPEWCADQWCYVDHTNCKYPAVKSSYFSGVDLRYSYTTCGSKNTFDAWFDENAAASGAQLFKAPKKLSRKVGRRGSWADVAMQSRADQEAMQLSASGVPVDPFPLTCEPSVDDSGGGEAADCC